VEVEESADEDTIRFYVAGTEAMVIDTNGYVGIGTSVPGYKLDVTDTTAGLGVASGIHSNGVGGALAAYSSTFPAPFTHFAGRVSLFSDAFSATGIDIRADGGTSDIRFYTGGLLSTHERMRITPTGDVGLGTTTPTGKLELSSADPKLYFNRQESTTNYSGIYWRTTSDNFEGAFVRNNANGTFEFYTDLTGGSPRMVLTNSGYMGINITNPDVLLQVSTTTQFDPGNYSDLRKGSLLLSLSGGTSGDGNYAAGMAFSGVNTSRRRAAIASIQTASDVDQVGLAFFTHPQTAATNDEVVQQMVITHDGKVGIGNEEPYTRLDVMGNVIIRDESNGLIALQLGTGLDYAEGFDVSSKEDIDPGNVLSIDPENPGRLKISDQPYDGKVAGIVAGAGGLGSGVKLGSDEFDCDVALAGRVYCNTIALEGDIHPGDLLTTSPVPGFAMKVVDFEQARGAILGKAMEHLPNGERGQILVLVTLQ
jgi:hypothetical protein